MTIDDLLAEAARVALAERDRYSIGRSYESFGPPEGALCITGKNERNEHVIFVYDSEESECKLWIERRVLQVVFQWMAENSDKTVFMMNLFDPIGSFFKALTGQVA